MRITPDTNVLVRLITMDDAVQYAAAKDLMERADTVAIGLAALCELAWVLRRLYAATREGVFEAIRLLVDTEKVVTNRLAVEEGLRVLSAGGDFADGVIAYEGAAQGSQIFVSFDKTAVKLIRKNGRSAELLQ